MKRSRGFTLVEAVLVVGLLVIIGCGAFIWQQTVSGHKAAPNSAEKRPSQSSSTPTPVPSPVAVKPDDSWKTWKAADDLFVFRYPKDWQVNQTAGGSTNNEYEVRLTHKDTLAVEFRVAPFGITDSRGNTEFNERTIRAFTTGKLDGARYYRGADQSDSTEWYGVFGLERNSGGNALRITVNLDDNEDPAELGVLTTVTGITEQLFPR